MRLSEGVEWTVHCCVLLSAVPEGECLPGARLAEFHGVPGPYLTKHLQALTRAGVLASVPGPNGGDRRPPAAPGNTPRPAGWGVGRAPPPRPGPQNPPRGPPRGAPPPGGPPPPRP